MSARFAPRVHRELLPICSNNVRQRPLSDLGPTTPVVDSCQIRAGSESRTPPALNSNGDYSPRISPQAFIVSCAPPYVRSVAGRIPTRTGGYVSFGA